MAQKTQKVRIDEALLEQIDELDCFPKELWARRQKVSCLIRYGMSVLTGKSIVYSLQEKNGG